MGLSPEVWLTPMLPTSRNLVCLEFACRLPRYFMPGTHSHVRLMNHKVSQNVRSTRQLCNVLADTLHKAVQASNTIYCTKVFYLHVQQASMYSLKHDCRVATLGIMAKPRTCRQCKQWLDDATCAIFACDQASVACFSHKQAYQLSCCT